MFLKKILKELKDLEFCQLPEIDLNVLPVISDRLRHVVNEENFKEWLCDCYLRNEF